MKNAFGGLLHTHRHYTHSWIHGTLVDLLAIQKEIHPGIFAVMDGTTAGNGPGPRTMYPVVKNVMLASADQVAIDAVAAKMMGFDPMTHRVHPRGPRGRPRRRRPARDRDRRRRRVANESWGFHVGDNLASIGGDLFWFWPLKVFQKLLLPHADRPPVRVRLRGLPRLLPLAGEGPADVRAVEAGHAVGAAVPGVRGLGLSGARAQVGGVRAGGWRLAAAASVGVTSESVFCLLASEFWLLAFYSTFYPRVFGLVTALVLGGAVLLIIRPFVGPILWAALLALMLFPVNERLRSAFRGRKTAAALALTLASVLVLVVPAIVLGIVFGRQAADLVGRAQTSAAEHQIQRPIGRPAAPGRRAGHPVGRVDPAGEARPDHELAAVCRPAGHRVGAVGRRIAVRVGRRDRRGRSSSRCSCSSSSCATAR